jgi:membrane protein DedA with SNARE-associated domain
LEGETFVIISAVLCQTAHMSVAWVIWSAFLGALTGDLLCFWIGRVGGERFLIKRSFWQSRLYKASRLLKQHQSFIVFSYRFLYGLRAVIPFLIGATGYPFGRFLLLSSAGAMTWSITVTVAGLLCGKLLLHFVANIKGYQIWFICCIGLIGLICWTVYHKWSNRFR